MNVESYQAKVRDLGCILCLRLEDAWTKKKQKRGVQPVDRLYASVVRRARNTRFMIRARLLPLEGKYYGSRIEIIADAGVEIVEVWISGDGKPSKREIEELGYTEEQWEKNIEIGDGFGGKCRIRDMDYFCDSHYETKDCHEVCLEIVDAINRSAKQSPK